MYSKLSKDPIKVAVAIFRDNFDLRVVYLDRLINMLIYNLQLFLKFKTHYKRSNKYIV